MKLDGYRVLITGASPDRTNRNSALRQYVVQGFSELLGSVRVSHCSFEQAAEKVVESKPDALICFGSCMPEDAEYGAIRKSCDETRSALVFWLHDDPYEFDYNYKVCEVADFIFTNDKWSSYHYDHPHTFHLPLAASKDAHWRPTQKKKEIEIFFCGVAFPNRIRLVKDLSPTLSRYETVILGDQWPEKEIIFLKNKRLSNIELSDHYAHSLITLNMGRDFHFANERYKLEPSTPGPRTFEAAMAGTVQLYFVESLEITDYYLANKEIILFDSAQSFKEEVEELTTNSNRTLQLSIAAQQRTIQDHTYMKRAQSILKQINMKIS